ncbi:MAG: HAD family phosphatase [Bryobacterales bacterium]|nr:HAD family phosphatase [Bryobacterales bacterium]
MKNHIEAVLFDFDGVLVDSEPIHFAAWQEALAPFGVALPVDPYYTRFIGLEDRAAIRMLAAEQVPPREFDELWPAFQVKKHIFNERFEKAPQVVDKTRDVIAELSAAGYRLGVVTSSSVQEVDPILVRNGIRQYMQTCVFAEDVARKKPHPEPYLTAKHRLGVERALVLEDSHAGMESAQASGCEVIRVTEVGEVAGLLRARLGLGV